MIHGAPEEGGSHLAGPGLAPQTRWALTCACEEAGQERRSKSGGSDALVSGALFAAMRYKRSILSYTNTHSQNSVIVVKELLLAPREPQPPTLHSCWKLVLLF